jgi:hypothetical protein
MPLLDPDPDRDAVFARRIALPAKQEQQTWKNGAVEALRTTSTLHCRAQIYGLLASGDARTDRTKAAVDWLMSAPLASCGSSMYKKIWLLTFYKWCCT